VVHGDLNPRNIRMTVDRVALIDWDESHVDVADLDLVLPHNAAGLDGDALTSPRKRRLHGKPPFAGTRSGPTWTMSGRPLIVRSSTTYAARP
jgi:hypothetical protein